MTLIIPGGGFITCDDVTDIVKLRFNGFSFGAVELDLRDVEVAMQPIVGGSVVTTNAMIKDGSGKTFSKYDLNKDKAVALADVSVAAMAIGLKSDNPDWNSKQLSTNSLKEAVTPAMCDVNSDGEVDMLDLLDILANYTK
jgi:hypothetical protein